MPGFHPYVTGEYMPAAGQHPGVNMMHVADALEFLKRRGHLLKVHIVRRSLHEHMNRLLQDSPACPNENKPKRHTKQRIDQQEAGETDNKRRNDDEQTA